MLKFLRCKATKSVLETKLIFGNINFMSFINTDIFFVFCFLFIFKVPAEQKNLIVPLISDKYRMVLVLYIEIPIMYLIRVSCPSSYASSETSKTSVFDSKNLKFLKLSSFFSFFKKNI